MNKIRLKTEDEKNWRYALTTAPNGCILSSTTNHERASSFKDNVSSVVGDYYAKLKETKKTKIQVEVF